ncbi:O-antigen ligase family protein [Pseudarthrobacter sp. S9]|uniref:O-antigen ligase family protein n=1 Tax=Pseudarthrobacter sp. S9 TaxID=3418421 RepID=UPI003D070DA2
MLPLREWQGARPVLVNRIWVIALAATIITICVAAYSGLLMFVSVTSLGLLLAFLFPMPATVASVAWVLLVRPNTRLIQGTFAGFNVTEIDALVLLALIACSRISRKQGILQVHSRLSDWWPILAWPSWMLARSIMPSVGDVGFGSPLVDLRILSAFLLIVPLWTIASRRGGPALLGIICYSAYAACGIAIIAWALAQMHVVPRGSYPLANLALGAAQDVRPGGEVLIPILAVLLVFRQAPLLFNSRIASLGIVFGEILVSQTLSIAIASAVGICLALFTNWRQTSLASRMLICVILFGGGFMALSGTGTSTGADADISSRFNLAERIGQTSAQYRVTEAETVARIYEDEPLVFMIGTGPGSLVTFNEGALHEIKDLTHNVYNNVILKTGVLGLLMFAGGFLVLMSRLLRRSDALQRSLAGSLVAIAVLSLTVPFASTVSGLAGLLALATLAVWHLVGTSTVKHRVNQ